MSPEHARELLTYLFERCGYKVEKLNLRRRLIGWSTSAKLTHPERGYMCVGGVISHDYTTYERWAPTLSLLVGKMATIYDGEAQIAQGSGRKEAVTDADR